MALPSSGNSISILDLAREKVYDNYADDRIPYTGGSNKHPYPLDGYVWAPTGVRCTLSRDTGQSSPASEDSTGAGALKMTCTTTNDPYTDTYSDADYRHTAATQSETWTFSFYAKADTSRTCAIFMFSAVSAGTLIANTSYNHPNPNAAYAYESISVTTSWQRFDMTHQVCSSTNSSNDCAYVQVRMDGPQGGDNAVIWFDGMQLEEAGAVTDFTMNGPYSLLDLIDGSDYNSSMDFEPTNQDSTEYPNTVSPHAMSEWYEYDHDAEELDK